MSTWIQSIRNFFGIGTEPLPEQPEEFAIVQQPTIATIEEKPLAVNSDVTINGSLTITGQSTTVTTVTEAPSPVVTSSPKKRLSPKRTSSPKKAKR
jgi:hypothetical protein